MNKWKVISLLLTAIVIFLVGGVVDERIENSYQRSQNDYLLAKNNFLQQENSDLQKKVSFYSELSGSLSRANEENKGKVKELDQANNEKIKRIKALVQKGNAQAKTAKERIRGLEKLTDSFIYPQEIIETVSRDELKNVLRRYYRRARIKLWDEEYRLVSIEVLREFLVNDNTSNLLYIRSDGTGAAMVDDYLDCDDFVFRLKGQAVKAGIQNLGIAEGKRKTPFGVSYNHAFNVFVTRDSDGELVVYEVEPSRYSVIEKIEKRKYQTFFVLF